MKTSLVTDITVEDVCKGFVYNEYEGKGLFGLSGNFFNLRLGDCLLDFLPLSRRLKVTDLRVYFLFLKEKVRKRSKKRGGVLSRFISVQFGSVYRRLPAVSC